MAGWGGEDVAGGRVSGGGRGQPGGQRGGEGWERRRHRRRYVRERSGSAEVSRPTDFESRVAQVVIVSIMLFGGQVKWYFCDGRTRNLTAFITRYRYR